MAYRPIERFRDQLVAGFVTCGGLGRIRRGSGTWASAVAAVFWSVLMIVGVSKLLLAGSILILLTLGVWAARIYEQKIETQDSSEVVIDEWVGMGISLLVVPAEGWSHFWWLALVAFIGFRVFDIWKPFGIKFFDDHYLEGWGVMLDDALAGLYTALLIAVLVWLL